MSKAALSREAVLSRKAVLRIKDFTTGMKNLNIDSQNYIHELVHILLVVDQSADDKSDKRKSQKSKTARMGC